MIASRTSPVSVAALGLLASTLFAAAPLTAQPALQGDGGASSVRRVPVLDAMRVQEDEPTIDGRLDDAAWASAPVATDFIQFEPDPGAPASQRTEARILYGDDAIWVAIRAWDTAADSITGQLTRRDQGSYSDVVAVVIDSYFDRRSAFHFEVNPLGVKSDLYRFDDTQEDRSWDAVWEVATSRDDQGWSAEFRIPLSQLRFREAEVQTWGINFMRRIARREETSLWAPTSRSESAIVSRFGELQGIRDLDPPRRLELTPYSVARVTRAPGNEANPFYARNAVFGTVGADLKYGITTDLTLNVTLNPDFGQVEADPAQVNLSAYETFLPERRPFFVEGANLFDFSLALGDGDDAVESLFYSRRIGRAPQGRADPRGGYAEVDDQTTILGAWKLSGKTASGWSVGLMSAMTAEERAEVAPDEGPRLDVPVEPFTTHSVARVQKDFREGRTAVGMIGTAVNREQDVADEIGLRTGAYSGGVDLRHRFGGDRFQLRGYLLGSHIRGSEDAILSAQRSSARYFQRPDADHVEVDPTRTSLSGYSATLTLGRISGGPWRYSTGYQTRSPGFDSNDAGYMRETDYHVWFGYVGYDRSSPMGPFRRWRMNANTSNSWSWGGERYSTTGNVNGNFQLQNFWGGYAGVNVSADGYSNSLLRGGPLLKREGGVNGWWGFNTDSRQPVRGNLNGRWNVRSESDSWTVAISPSVTWRPSGRASLSFGGSLTRAVDDRQWVGRFGPSEDPTYLLGRLDQTTLGLTVRADYSFTPTLSLQFYGQPFVSAGEYSAFKRVTDPRGDRYADRLEGVELTYDGDADRWEGDVTGDGSGDGFARPDFNIRQLRTNTVVRWEYRPGSALFVVWAQGRNGEGLPGHFDMNGDFREIFSDHPSNTVMVKLSWWLNP